MEELKMKKKEYFAEQTVKIETLKFGEYFKKKATSKKIFRLDEFCRFNKAYQATDFEDCSNFIYLKKGTNIFVGFEF